MATRVGLTAWVYGRIRIYDCALYGFSIDERLFRGVHNPEGPNVFSIDISTGAARLASDLNVPFVFGALRLADLPAGNCKLQ